MPVSYEWTVELIDAHEDIVDSHYFDTLADAVEFSGRHDRSDDGIVKTDIGLVRNDDDGNSWAYIVDGKLDMYLRDSYQNALYDTPKKYLKEVTKVLGKVTA